MPLLSGRAAIGAGAYYGTMSTHASPIAAWQAARRRAAELRILIGQALYRVQAATGLPVCDIHSMITGLRAGLRPQAFRLRPRVMQETR